MVGDVLQNLSSARRIADYADRLGVFNSDIDDRPVQSHVGAILADAILQAGMNYRSVVRVRVERIFGEYPQAATLSGVMSLIENDAASAFLSWNHPEKVRRFVVLAQFLAMQRVETADDMRVWLVQKAARQGLLDLSGVGPKTYDYLCGLVGIDSVAIDRHVRVFAAEAGVVADDYDVLKIAVSFAADLLGVSRRGFDSWIWRTVSSRRLESQH